MFSTSRKKNMKNYRSLLLTGIIAFTMLISSCATTVTVSYMQPAKFNLSDYKNLAIATTNVVSSPIYYDNRIRLSYDNYNKYILSGYDRMIPSDIADYYTDQVYKKLSNSNLFNIIPPFVTDQYLKGIRYGISNSSQLYDKGADAIFTSEIEYLDYDEYPIYGDYIRIKNPNYVVGGIYPEYINSDVKNVTIIQVAKMKISYSIIDLQDGSVLATNSYVREYKNSVVLNEYTNLDAQWLFRDIVDTFVTTTKNDLVPHTVYASLELMDNKPTNALAEQAMKLVDKNQLLQAQMLFDQAWNQAYHLPSGYNSALLLEAMGKRPEAILLMQDVYNKTGSTDAIREYSRMKSYENSSSIAQKQIED